MADRDILVRLRLAGEEFSRGFKDRMAEIEGEAGASGEVVGEAFGKGFNARSAAWIATGASGLAVLQQAVSKSLDLARDLDTTSKQVGVQVERLQELRFAAGEVGVQFADLDNTLGDLTRTIGQAVAGDRKAQEAFTDLGVSFETTSGKARSTDAVLLDLAERMASIEDPAQRAQLGAALLGEEFNKLEPLLMGGADGLRAASDEAREFGAVLSSEDIRQLNQVNADLERMKTILSARIAGAVAENTDAIHSLAAGLGSLAVQAINATGRMVQFFEQLRAQRAINEANYINNRSDIYSDSQRAAARRRAADASFVKAIAEDRVTRASTSFVDGFLQEVRNPTPRATAPTVDPRPARARSGGGGSRTRSGGGRPRQSDEAREREQAIKAAQRAEEQFAEAVRDSLREQKDSAAVERIRAEQGEVAAAAEEARLGFLEQHPLAVHQTVEALAKALGITRELGEADKTRLKTLIDQADAAEKGAVEGARGAAQKREDEKRQREEERAREEAQREMERAREEEMRAWEDSVQDLAGLYEDLFTGNTGNIVGNFKSMFLGAISEIAAQYTLALLSGQSAGSLESVAGSVLGKSPLFSILGGGARTGFGGLASNDNGGFDFSLPGVDFGGTPGINPDAPMGDYGVPGVDMGATGRGSILESPGFAIGAGLLVNSLGIGGGGQMGQLITTATAMAGQAIGTALGGPIGGAIGSIFGSLAGSALSSIDGLSKDASAWSTISTNADGAYVSNSTSAGGGDTAGRDSLANAAIDTISQIAEALGGNVVGGLNLGSIGVRKGQAVTDWTPGTKEGREYYGSPEEAIKAYLAHALEVGVIDGISEASKRILASGQDLEKAIEKAALIESIPKLLRERLDPLGAALDELDAKFRKVADAMREGGASAEQIAQARQLWQLEREDTIAQIGAASKGLKDFLASLNAGPNSPLSLRQQQAEAEAQLAPFLQQIAEAEAARAEVDRLRASGGSADAVAAAETAARIAAGKIDEEGFQSASQLLLGIARQTDASTGGFFAEFDRIRALTGDAIDLIDRATPTPGAGTDPFAAITADNTKATAELLADAVPLLQAINDNFARLSPTGTNWLLDSRQFAL